jgi:hypothetical protein
LNLCIGVGINDGGWNEVEWLVQAPRVIPDKQNN